MAIKSADQITIVDVTDAYSIILTSEAYTFVGNTSGAPSGLSCTTQAVAFCGTNQCSAVNVNANDITCPTGISASVSNSGGSSPTITFTTVSTVTNSCEATIPVVVDGITVNKKFSFAVAKAGNNGSSVTVSSTSVTYATSSSGTSAPSSGWSSTIPSVDNGKYLWTKTYVKYSDGKETTSYSVAYKGTNGSNGQNGQDGTSVTISSTSIKYQAGSSGTNKPTGTWSTSVPNVSNGQYLWTQTIVTYSDGTKTEAYSVAYKGTNGTNGKDGADGADGADAITMTITASNGTVFKNSTGTTVLTAHVYVGGVEQSITDAGVCGSLGSVKWYKGTSTTAVATAKTLTVSASEVTNSAAYTCQLEK